MKKIFIKLKNENGAIAILALLGVMTIVLAAITTMSALLMGELKMSSAGGAMGQTYYTAESGLNDALYRLLKFPEIGTNNYAYASGNLEIDIKPDPSDPYRRIVESKAIGPSGQIRTLRIKVQTNSFAGGFDYAVQGGAGGVEMENNSEVHGDIYSNGDISGSGGAVGRPEIHGSAWAADNSTISKVIINNDAHAENISASTDVAGIRDETDQPVKNFPLSQTDIQAWKNDIVAVGNPVITENPADCPNAYSSGFYCVTDDTVIESAKIDAGFYIGNGAKLTLRGSLWISGDLMLDNNGVIKIDPSLGAGSVAIINDGIIDVGPNYSINESGHPKSFVIVVSTNNSLDPSSPAIYASNNSNAVVFVVLDGLLKVKNNGALNAAAAHSLYLEQKSSVTFNSLISSFYLPAAGGEEVLAVLDSWEEL